nr:RNA polymerase II transcriptional coactivator KELP [Tanacetum cinerariifolium]
MEPELKSKIEETVLEILKNSDMESTTEYKVRKSASEKLGIDLSESERKKLVRNVVQTYLEQAKEDEQQQVEEEEEESEEDDKKKVGGKEYDDDGDLILCRIPSPGNLNRKTPSVYPLLSVSALIMKCNLCVMELRCVWHFDLNDYLIMVVDTQFLLFRYTETVSGYLISQGLRGQLICLVVATPCNKSDPD